jgi:lipopolysaccharide transport system ATP-binding protein
MLNLRKKLSQPSDEVLLKCDKIGKKFSKNLKSSLKYAISDIAKDTLGKVFPKKEFTHSLRKDEFWALKSISFELRRGECLGLLGANGAGKSTLLRVLSGIIKQDKGSFSINGSIGGIIALGAGFNPILSGRENLSVYAAIKGLSQNTLKEKEQEIIEFSELEEFIDAPFRTYSSGMQVRLAFSAAAILEVPDILLIDEVLAVGDMQFIGKCFNLIEDIKKKSALILVSHSMANIRRFCNKCCLLENGVVATESKNIEEVIDEYSSRYYRELNSSNKFWISSNNATNSKFSQDFLKKESISLNFDITSSVSYLEIILKRFGNDNVMAFKNTSLERLPVVGISSETQQKIDIDLREIPVGNYYFCISFLDQKGNYLERFNETCPFQITGNTESFSPIVRKLQSV